MIDNVYPIRGNRRGKSLAADLSALIEAFTEKGIILVGVDMAKTDGSASFMRAKLVDGEVRYEVVPAEDFYAAPVEIISRDEMTDRFPVPC